MKKLIITLLFLLLSCSISFAENQQLAWMSPWVAGSVAAAPASYHCDSTSDSDILCEDFSGSGTDCDGAGASTDTNCRNAYTTNYGAGSIDYNASHSGTLSCSDKGSYAIQITKDSTNSYNHATKTWTDTDNAYIQFYLNVVTGTGTGASITIATLRGDSNAVIQLLLSESSGNQRLQISYHNGTGVTSGSYQTISTGTWYRIRLVWNKSSGASDGVVNFYVDDTAVTNITNNNSTYDTDEFRFGQGSANDADTYVIQFDNLKIDDDTEPGACS